MIIPQQDYIYGSILDKYLAQGYYRMGSNFCTLHKIWYDERYCNVYWLRYDLKKVVTRKSHLQIIKNAKIFSIEIQKLKSTTSLEKLYNLYAMEIKFEASQSLQEYLSSYEAYYNSKPSLFNTNLITITYNNDIIAAGIYDDGKNSIAGIINFYDPEYKQYSLGKMLILAKLQYAIKQTKQYYYPGYIVPGITNFEYKTFVGKQCIEVWDAEKQEWVSYNNFFEELYK